MSERQGMEHPGFWVGALVGVIFGTVCTLELMLAFGLLDRLLGICR